MTMLLAGEDTTANTLAWTIYLLHRNPAVLDRAREEVDRVAGRVRRLDAGADRRAALCRGLRQRDDAPEAGRAVRS